MTPEEEAKQWQTMYEGARAAYMSPRRINWGWCHSQHEYGYFIDDWYSGSDLDGLFCEIGNLVQSGDWNSKLLRNPNGRN